MDAEKFGMFIAARRKEKNMTQAELAGKLNVTDKAVSKWERGMGFPDIHSLEPLAEALEISLFELMRSERIADGNVSREAASAAVEDALCMVKARRREERKALIRVFLAFVLLFSMYLWLDDIGLEIFMMIYIPIICLYGGIFLLTYGLWRLIRRQSCLQTFLFAGVLLLVPLSVFLLLIYGLVHGLGPVPS